MTAVLCAGIFTSAIRDLQIPLHRSCQTLRAAPGPTRHPLCTLEPASTTRPNHFCPRRSQLKQRSLKRFYPDTHASRIACTRSHSAAIRHSTPDSKRILPPLSGTAIAMNSEVTPSQVLAQKERWNEPKTARHSHHCLPCSERLFTSCLPHDRQ